MRRRLFLVAILIAASFAARAEPAAQPRLTSISVEPRSIKLEPGESYAFTVRGRYSDGSARLLTDKAIWSIDDESVATIDANGRAVANKNGKATIVAAIGELRAMARLQVGEQIAPAPRPRPPVVQAIVVEPPADSLPTGETQRFTAKARYSNGEVRDVTKEAVWASSDVAVARVGFDGTVVGVSHGTATIAATLQTYSGAAALTVTPIIASIAIVPDALSVRHHGNGRLKAIATLTDNTTRDITDEVTWTSSDEEVASVSSGAIAGIAPGRAIITATLDDFSTSSIATVEPVIRSIAVRPPSAHLTVGDIQQFTAIATFSDGTSKDVTASVTWSRDSAAVSVSPAGLVTAIAEGSANVKAALDSVEDVTNVVVSKATGPPGTGE